MKSRNHWSQHVRTGVVAALCLALAGCLAEDEYNVDPPSVPTGSDGTPLFTDLYIEYPAPHARWAAGDNFSLHITTRDATRGGELAIIQGDHVRRPASAKGEAMVAGAGEALLPLAVSREQMTRLYSATERSKLEEARGGCMYPLRVRFLRGDGVLLERSDCRGGAEWTRIASDVVGEFRRLARK